MKPPKGNDGSYLPHPASFKGARYPRWFQTATFWIALVSVAAYFLTKLSPF